VAVEIAPSNYDGIENILCNKCNRWMTFDKFFDDGIRIHYQLREWKGKCFYVCASCYTDYTDRNRISGIENRTKRPLTPEDMERLGYGEPKKRIVPLTAQDLKDMGYG